MLFLHIVHFQILAHMEKVILALKFHNLRQDFQLGQQIQ
jgi:hypothetical protein